MKYNFEKRVDRKNTGSFKWAAVERSEFDQPDYVTPFSVADMEFENAPEILSGLQNSLDHAVLGYTGPTDAYYNAIIHWMKRRHDWDIKKEWVVTTPGVVIALNYLVEAYVKENEGVIILTPSYGPFFSAIKRNNSVVVESKLLSENGEYLVNFEELEALAKEENNTCMILCSPHNPTGKVFSKEELIRIADICFENHVQLIVDEIHHDIIMAGYKHTVLASISEKYADMVVTCTSCSKTFNLAGLQVSNIIIKNEELRSRFNVALNHGGLHGLNALAYKACEFAYNDAEAWLDECLSVINGNKEYLKETLKEKMPEVTCSDIQGTYLAWLSFEAFDADDEELDRIAKKHHLFFSSGVSFGKEGKKYERLNLACPRAVLKRGLADLYEMVKELRVHE